MKKPSRKRKAAPPTTPPTAPERKTAAIPLSPARKWSFRIVALLLPVAFLVLIELALRLGGYGYPTPFFKKLRIQGEDFLVQNDDFSLRFFPPEIARNPGPIRIRAHKRPGSCRIFIFGESAAMGDPEPAFGAGRYLEKLLQDRHPDMEFEIVNVAFTAINSHVILPLARECASHQGDLWIIYMGNNEMIGPFGAATVFGPKAPPLFLVRLSTTLQKTRVGQLIIDLGRKIGSKPASSSWGGMQMFLQNQLAPDDPHKPAVYRHFHDNLQGIVRAGLNSGAQVLLSTVAVNLRDCAPFASATNHTLSVAQSTQLEEWFAEGIRAESQGKFADAAALYEKTAGLDPHLAELQFRWGTCLLHLTNSLIARPHFQSACDDDALPFRADSRINALIRDVAREHGGTKLALLEAEAALQTNTLTGGASLTTNRPAIPGEEYFYEHVHFNFDGNYRLGLAWAAEVERFLPPAARQASAKNWMSQSDCEQRLGLTEWNRSFVLESLIRRVQQPPLSSQLNQAARLESFQQQLLELRKKFEPARAARERQELLAQIQHSPGDFYLREGFAEFLEANGDFHQAELQWREVRKLIPQDFLACFQLGRMLAKQNQFPEAATELTAAIALRPTLAEAWVELGRVQATSGQFRQAVESFDRAHRLRPQDPVSLSYKGKALSNLGKRAEAIALYRQAIQLNPAYWEAHNALADELASDGNTADAAAEYEMVLRQNPGYAMAHLNLGVMRVKQGRLEEGRQCFEAALRLEPSNKTARQYLDQVDTWKQKQR